jgi:hypothetical protein
MIIAIVVSLLMGAGAGYGFRGLVRKNIAKVEAAATTDLKKL